MEIVLATQPNNTIIGFTYQISASAQAWWLCLWHRWPYIVELCCIWIVNWRLRLLSSRLEWLIWRCSWTWIRYLFVIKCWRCPWCFNRPWNLNRSWLFKIIL